jgi:hypothetical protein
MNAIKILILMSIIIFAHSLVSCDFVSKPPHPTEDDLEELIEWQLTQDPLLDHSEKLRYIIELFDVKILKTNKKSETLFEIEFKVQYAAKIHCYYLERNQNEYIPAIAVQTPDDFSFKACLQLHPRQIIGKTGKLTFKKTNSGWDVIGKNQAYYDKYNQRNSNQER